MKRKSIVILTVVVLALGVMSCRPMDQVQMATAEAIAGQTTESAAVESTATGDRSIAAESAAEAAGKEAFDYADKLFDTSRIHDINIEISEEDWKDVLAHPLDKPKAYVTAAIDGEIYEDVRFSPKGNASLFLVAANSASDRYSFKLKFDKKDKTRTYHGLDELVLNNSFDDPSYMRDYAAALIFRQQGVPTALMSFTKLYVNGEFYGVYLAAETVGEAFVKRVWDGKGNLYKPESEVLKARDGAIVDSIRNAIDNGTTEEFLRDLHVEALRSDYATPGADLKYTGDDLKKYTDITDNSVTDINDEDVHKLIVALKSLSIGNYDQAIDENEVLRYFAVHNFIGNSDGYTSTMLHNYMLYENVGILSMIPWDYNAAMLPQRVVTGGRDERSWTEMINMGIDSPTYEGVSLNDRPMLGWIFEDEAAHAEYEKLTKGIIDYVRSGDFEKEMQRMHDQIAPYVAEDPTAFFTSEEFEDSYRDIINFCMLRAESLEKQLDGSLAKVTAEQNPDERVKYKN